MNKKTKSAPIEVAKYRFQRNGALAIQYLELTTGRSQILRIGPSSRVSLLPATPTDWEEVKLRAGHSPWKGRLLVTNRSTKNNADAIAVTNTARNDRGDKLESSGVLAGRDDYQWRRVFERHRGPRVETETSGDRISRTAFDGRGQLRWTSEASYQANPAVGVPVRSSTDSIRDSNGREIGKITKWESASGSGSYTQLNDGSTRHQIHREYYPDGRRKSATEQWTDGRSGHSTHEEWDKQNGLEHHRTVTTDSGQGGTTTHTT